MLHIKLLANRIVWKYISVIAMYTRASVPIR